MSLSDVGANDAGNNDGDDNDAGAATPLLKHTVDTVLNNVPAEEQDNDEWGGRDARRLLENSLLSKLDKRMSILILIYILNYIDRNNVAAARLRGFEEDLRLEGQQFATLLSILYIGYISMQIPSNIFLNHIGKPSLYLPACMVLWGCLSVATGFATNFYGALLTRFCLGIVEASFFPGALFLISKWYKHNELGSRTTLLFCGNIISNAFGSLIASLILDTMDGVLGRTGWRWLFYVEGTLTVLVALLALLVLPDFPETTAPGWLSDNEIRLAIQRMQEDTDVHDDACTPPSSGFWAAVSDPHVYILTLIMGTQIVANSFNMYFPTLTKTLGYSAPITLLLCAPPFLVCAVLAFLNSRHSDKTGERFYHINVPVAVAMAGFIIATQTMDVRLRYVSLFLMAQSYAGFAIFYGWLSNVFPSPPAKRAVALAFINSVSQLGNITGSYVWSSSWGPTYRKSFAICIAASACSVVACYVLKRRLEAMNRRLAHVERERGATTSGFRYLH